MIIIYIALFATFAIDYFSAALTGSFIWETADTWVHGKIPLSRITEGTLRKKEPIYDIPLILDLDNFVSQFIAMASASASIAWGTSQPNSILDIIKPSTTFRCVINGAQYISTNSTLGIIMMPCLCTLHSPTHSSWTPPGLCQSPDGLHSVQMDSIQSRWTPFSPDGLHSVQMDSIQSRWTPFSPGGVYLEYNQMYIFWIIKLESIWSLHTLQMDSTQIQLNLNQESLNR